MRFTEDVSASLLTSWITGAWLSLAFTAVEAPLHRPPLLHALSGHSSSPSAHFGRILIVRVTLALAPALSLTCELINSSRGNHRRSAGLSCRLPRPPPQCACSRRRAPRPTLLRSALQARTVKVIVCSFLGSDVSMVHWSRPSWSKRLPQTVTRRVKSPARAGGSKDAAGSAAWRRLAACVAPDMVACYRRAASGDGWRGWERSGSVAPARTVFGVRGRGAAVACVRQRGRGGALGVGVVLIDLHCRRAGQADGGTHVGLGARR